MKNHILSLILAFTSLIAVAQNPNYSEHVAPIIYDNCSGCHHAGGIAPFSLMSFNDASVYSSLISYDVSNGIMPPWPADSIDGGFVHERVLSSVEIKTIVDWVSNGTPEGNSALAPSPPAFSGNSVLGTPDIQVVAPKYTSKATSSDEYVCFTIPTSFSTDKWIEAIEVMPGNTEIVHHCLVYIDESGTYQADTSSGACGGPDGGILLGEYVPGSQPIVYPNDGATKFGVKLKAGAQLVLAIHYPEGSAGKLDSTKVNLHFYPDGTTGIREVYASSIISDWAFCIDSNEVKTVASKYPATGGLLGQFSVMAFFPHMHLLGQEISAWAITPTNDSIPLGSISDWDFEWQGFYAYKKMKVLPVGSVIYGKAVYDNTSSNVFNPNSPPKQVCAGANTSDEMFLIYFQYLLYQAGDENIDIDAILDPISVLNKPLTTYDLGLSPNPVSKGGGVNITTQSDLKSTLEVYDMKGKVVHAQKIEAVGGKLNWQNNLASGIYFISVKNSAQRQVGKLVVQ
ncbi:MAG: hypothetical protein ACJAZ2_002072 [Glaciecola sp.]|jgi:hypothetical protein